MLPLLQVLGEAGEGVPQQDLTRRVADRVHLSDELRKMTLGSGQLMIHNRTGWAGWYMKQAGLLENVKRGVWAITEEGRKLLATKPNEITVKSLYAYPSFAAKMADTKTDEPGVAPLRQSLGISRAGGRGRRR